MLQNSGLGPQNEQYLISDEKFILLQACKKLHDSKFSQHCWWRWKYF